MSVGKILESGVCGNPAQIFLDRRDGNFIWAKNTVEMEPGGNALPEEKHPFQ